MPTVENREIRNTVSMDRAILAPSARTFVCHDKLTPTLFVDEQEEKIDEGKGHRTAYELADGFQKCAVDQIVCHVHWLKGPSTSFIGTDKHWMTKTLNSLSTNPNILALLLGT